MKNSGNKRIEFSNRKARFNYELLDKFTAGIVLYGTEIKSIRAGKVNLSEAFCIVNRGEVWVRGMHISEYKFGSFYNHEALRERKLLLTKKEIRKIERLTLEPGITIVPTLLFINEKHLAKLQIAVAKGKKSYDKRQTIKERDDKRQMERFFKK